MAKKKGQASDVVERRIGKLHKTHSQAGEAVFK